jgi:hypothetical protein
MWVHRSPNVLHVLAAVLCAAVAALYAVVSLEVVTVPSVAEVEPGPAVPLVIAAVAFAVLAVLPAFGDRRGVLVGGIVLELVVLAGYVGVASSRHPSFEVWGLFIKAVQVVLLALLLRLAVQLRAPRGGLS